MRSHRRLTLRLLIDPSNPARKSWVAREGEEGQGQRSPDVASSAEAGAIATMHCFLLNAPVPQLIHWLHGQNQAYLLQAPLQHLVLILLPPLSVTSASTTLSPLSSIVAPPPPTRPQHLAPSSGDLVSSFSLPARVTAVAMSRVATCHCLVAGACQQQHVRLCDPSSGAFTHTLTGHR